MIPSDNLGNQSVIIVISVVDWAGGTPLIFDKKIGAYRVYYDPKYHFVWYCGPIFVIKLTGDMVGVNAILKITIASFTTTVVTTASLDMSASYSASSATPMTE